MASPLDQIQKLNKEIQDLSKQLGKDIKIFDVNDLKTAEQVLKGLRAEIRDIQSDIGSIASAFKTVVDEISKSSKGLADTKKSFNSLSGLAQKLKNDQEGISKLNKKDLQSINAKIKAERENLVTTRDVLKNKKSTVGLTKEEEQALTEINSILTGNDGLYKNLLITAKSRLDQEEKINEAMGLGGALIGGLKKGLDKLGLGGLVDQLGIDDAEEAMSKVADKVTKGGTETATFGGKVQILKAGIGSLGKSMIKNLTDPLALSKLLFDEVIAALQASDKATGELAKGMNMSYNEASSMRNELQSVSNLSGDILITTKGLQESLMAVNAELGTNVMLNSENLKTYTKLREAAGLTMEDQKGIVALTNATKGNAEDITKEFLGAARATATNNKAVLNEKTLLKDISNISAATTLSFGKDAGLIGQTVAKVKALGMEMSKVDDIAGSLLDFESSIENELQAELMLGKDINLEKARQAALNNDLATVASEIAKQAGSAAEFTNMNRIRQDALAKAVGMNREELAKMLFVQEQIGNVSEEEANLREQRINKLQAEGLSNEQIKKKLGEESFEDLKNQASVQEKLNKSVEKLREVFISLAGPVMQLVSPIIDLLIPALAGISFILEPVFTAFRGMSEILTGSFDTLSGWEMVLGGILTVITGITVATKIQAGITAGIAAMNAVIALQKKLQSKEDLKLLALGKSKIIQLAAQAALWALSNPFKALLGLAAAATVGAVAMNYSKVGDLKIDPNGGPIVSSPNEGGIFQGTKNDELRMGPTRALDMATQGGGSQTQVVQSVTDMSTTNKLLAQLVKKTPEMAPLGLYEIQ